MIQQALAALVQGRDLDPGEARGAMEEVMAGDVSPAQMGAFLTALRMKGETPSEIAAFAGVLRAKCLTIHPRVVGAPVDLCGTGGAPFKTFNVSTIASFVVAGAGVPVAKHGNRSFTSSCGSADLLEALGVRIDLEPPAVERVMEEVNICFMFAPKFHPAMKHVAPVRRELGVRTVFNLLGPLANPAGARHHLMGVFDGGLVWTIPEVMRLLGYERGLVVHGEIGSDEISTVGPTLVGELRDGEVRRYLFDPATVGLGKGEAAAMGPLSPPEAARLTLALLAGAKGPRRDMVLLNAAAALYVADRVADLDGGMAMASEALDSGRALRKLRDLVRATGGDGMRLEGAG
jgi:anthranilate phosphoribosyltransferase